MSRQIEDRYDKQRVESYRPLGSLLNSKEGSATVDQVPKRSKLQSKHYLDWMRKRVAKKQEIKENYLYTPSELKEQRRLQNVFKVIDMDNSNAIDINEMRQMFQRYNIQISKEHIQELYRLANCNDPKVLTFKEFKNLSKNPSIQLFFSHLIRSIEQEGSKEGMQKYYPRSFASMISFFSFNIRRELKFREISGYNSTNQHQKTNSYFQRAFNSGNTSVDREAKHQKSTILENHDDIEKKWDSLVQMMNIQDIDDDNNNPYKEKLRIKKRFRQLFQRELKPPNEKIQQLRARVFEKQTQSIADEDSEDSVDLPYLSMQLAPEHYDVPRSKAVLQRKRSQTLSSISQQQQRINQSFNSQPGKTKLKIPKLLLKFPNLNNF